MNFLTFGPAPACRSLVARASLEGAEYLHERLVGQLGVALCRSDIRVSEELLDVLQLNAPSDRLRCECVLRALVELHPNPRLDEYQADRLRREAAGTDQTIASLTRSIFEEHWALQDELASPIGRVGDEKRGRIIHRLLAETEERLAASYETELRNVRRDLSTVLKRLDLLSVMVSQGYFVYLYHTPAIPDALRDSAIASAKGRYARWEDSIVQVLARGLFRLPTRVEKSGRPQRDPPDPSSHPEHSRG